MVSMEHKIPLESDPDFTSTQIGSIRNYSAILGKSIVGVARMADKLELRSKNFINCSSGLESFYNVGSGYPYH